MMKKILLVAAIILAVASCSGDERTPGDACFVTIETHSGYCTVYDAETKVMYTVSSGVYNHGSFTMLVNQDGTPKPYKGFQHEGSK